MSAAREGSSPDDTLQARVEAGGQVFQAARDQYIYQGVAPASPVAPDRISNLPKPPTRVFVGRTDELQRLDDLVEAGAGVVSQAVHGLGGVGKSELALQYARTRRSRYRVVWWVTAETPELLESGLAELTYRLHPEVQLVATSREAASRAVAWLQASSGWLLVLDNVENVDHVRPLLGQLDTGHVLITSRRDVGWDQLTAGCLRLDVLRAQASVRLLTERSGQSDVAAAGLLAAELGHLPLALTQAAGYLYQTRMPIGTYLDRLRAAPGRLLRIVAEGDPAKRAVARVWSLTLAKISRRNRLAVHVLRLLSFYAPDNVPRTVLAASTAQDPGRLDEALGVLASYNMVSLTTEMVSIHRLLQVVLRDQMRSQEADESDDQPRATTANATLELRVWTSALRLLKQTWPTDNPAEAFTIWPRWAALAPHANALAQNVPGTELDVLSDVPRGAVG